MLPAGRRTRLCRWSSPRQDTVTWTFLTHDLASETRDRDTGAEPARGFLAGSRRIWSDCGPGTAIERERGGGAIAHSTARAECEDPERVERAPHSERAFLVMGSRTECARTAPRVNHKLNPNELAQPAAIPQVTDAGTRLPSLAYIEAGLWLVRDDARRVMRVAGGRRP
jgi:hypothetical protein